MPKSYFLPGQPTRYPRSSDFKVKYTKLELDLDFDGKCFDGKATHIIESAGFPIERVTLDAAELNFRSVKVNGDPSRSMVSQHSIEIELGSKLLPEESATIETEYSATPRRGLYFRGPTKSEPNRVAQAFTQGQSEDSKYWYPCYDYPNMRTQTEIFLTLPQKMVAISNGKLLEISKPDSRGKVTWHFREDVPHSSYLTSIVAGDFAVQEDHGSVSLQYYYPKEKEGLVRRSFEKTQKMIEFFESVTGQKYPYPKYAQTVVSDFMYGGMENISATTLTELTLHDERAHLDFSSDSLVAHELAHQWFGDLITCRDWSNAWLNEGFATYFDELFKEHDLGSDEFQYFMMRSVPMQNFFEECERYERPIVTKRYWDADEMFDYHTYEKGSWVLNCLRGILGDDVFFRGIKLYVQRHKNSLVETSDFRRAMEDASGIELESFFDQWIYSAGYPEYSIEYAWNGESKTAGVVVEQTNAEIDSVPLFTNPIELTFELENGSSFSKKIRMETRRQAFSFPLDSRPKDVRFDPRNWILKNLKFKKPIEMHVFTLQHSENAMERVRACEELSSFSGDFAISALSGAIDSDRFWGVRLEASRALGKMGTRRALEVLLSKVGHKDHKTRRGIAAGLRYFAGLEEGEQAIHALIGLLENDESFYTRAHAAHSLGFYKKSDKAFEALRSNLVQDSYRDIVRYGLFQGLGEFGDQRGIPLAIEYLAHGKHFYGRLSAAYALGRLGKGDPKALDALIETRKDPDVYVKEAAAESVALLDETSCIPSLESWLASEMEGRVRRLLRESIWNLKERILQSERLSKFDSEIERLSKESKRAEERIASLEASFRHH